MRQTPSSVSILGLDPGLRSTGWGIVLTQGNRLIYGAHGFITSQSQLPLADRLTQIYRGLCGILEIHRPCEAAVEETFVNKNAASALKLGMARGVVLLAPSNHGVFVGEYSANKVKKSVVGAGHADKKQVALMVQRLLTGCPPVREDAADALAVAICHAHYRTLTPLFSKIS